MDKIKFATPDVGLHECTKVMQAIDTRWLTNGPVVREFEKQVAERSGCEKAVCFDSCTAAMEMSLRVLGIGPGDEVITTPFTYSSTAEVIRNVGAKIVFVDLAESGFEMDYGKVMEAINSRTKAIMPVDYGGVMCDYNAMYRAIASKMFLYEPSNPIQEALGRIAIIADAAHSFTAMQNGRLSGERADFTCFSFHVLKNITTGGEGGAVVWRKIEGVSNDEIETTLRLYGDHGQTSRDKSNGWEYDIALFGYNHIMTNLDAEMGLAQLDRFDEIEGKRIEVTKLYDTLIGGIRDTGVKAMLNHDGSKYKSSLHLYPVWIPDKGYEDDRFRNFVFLHMAKAGVPCNVHYKPLPMMTAYKNIGFDIKDYPHAYNTFRHVLTIPYHTELTPEAQAYIVETLGKVVR